MGRYVTALGKPAGTRLQGVSHLLRGGLLHGSAVVLLLLVLLRQSILRAVLASLPRQLSACTHVIHGSLHQAYADFGRILIACHCFTVH